MLTKRYMFLLWIPLAGMWFLIGAAVFFTVVAAALFLGVHVLPISGVLVAAMV